MGSLGPVSDDMANDFPIGLINNVLCEKQHGEIGYSDVKTRCLASPYSSESNGLHLPQRSEGENLYPTSQTPARSIVAVGVPPVGSSTRGVSGEDPVSVTAGRKAG